jgi:hypothetical protein
MNKADSVVSAVATGIAAAALATTGHAQTPPQTGPNSPACATNAGIGGNIEPLKYEGHLRTLQGGERVALIQTGNDLKGWPESKVSQWLTDYGCTKTDDLAKSKPQLAYILVKDAEEMQKALAALKADQPQQVFGPQQAPGRQAPPYGVQPGNYPPPAPPRGGGFVVVSPAPRIHPGHAIPSGAVLSDSKGEPVVQIRYGRLAYSQGVGPTNSGAANIDVTEPGTLNFKAREESKQLRQVVVDQACAPDAPSPINALCAGAGRDVLERTFAEAPKKYGILGTAVSTTTPGLN